MKKTSLFLIDLIVLYGSLALTLIIRYPENSSAQFSLHFIPFSIIFAVWLLIFYIFNLYDNDSLKNSVYFYSTLFRTIGIAFVISIAIFYLYPVRVITPKTNLLIFTAIFAGLECALRSGYNAIKEKKFKKSILIVGLNAQSLELAQFIKRNPQSGYELKYVIDISPEREKIEDDFERFGIIEGAENIENIIRTEKINTIVISPEAYRIPEIINIFYRSLEHRVSFQNLSSFYERLTNKIPLGAINQVWFLENLSEGNKRTYEIAKRVYDIFLSSALGIVTLILCPLIFLAIKLESSGPIFYRQKRLGRLGNNFEIIKFRTMDNDAEKLTGPMWAVDGDPRITRIGKFLRKSRIDELPQLWNILKGEMSFVGPRAERPEFHQKLKENIPFYEERYLIKPGLTGWAQINFRYVSSIDDTAEKLQYDLFYIKNRSLMLDLGIILKTINISLRQAGR
jgi:exopolysaccharide biosynthesis polyprenyl glycosylphosphotransferase